MTEAWDGPGPVKGNFTIDFGSGATAVDSVTTLVVDTAANLSSHIDPAIRVMDGRDGDEQEMDPVIVTVGVVTPGVGFELIAQPAHPESVPDGQYIVSYERW